jgi:hypothetical protein
MFSGCRREFHSQSRDWLLAYKQPTAYFGFGFFVAVFLELL